MLSVRRWENAGYGNVYHLEATILLIFSLPSLTSISSKSQTWQWDYSQVCQTLNYIIFWEKNCGKKYIKLLFNISFTQKRIVQDRKWHFSCSLKSINQMIIQFLSLIVENIQDWRLYFLVKRFLEVWAFISIVASPLHM